MHGHRGGHDDHRLGGDQHGLRVVANVDTAIDAWLVDANRHANIGLGQRGAAHSGQGNQGKSSKFFHLGLSK